MDINKRTLEKILNPFQWLKVPFYQRRYVWDENELERFLDDIDGVVNGGNTHFMGPIILRQESIDSKNSEDEIYSVIDGQQRLTTLMILFKCLADKFEPHNKGNSKFFDNLLFSHYHQDTPIIAHNHNDKDIFDTIIKNQVGNDLLSQYSKERLNNNKVLSCYGYLTKQIKEKKDWDFAKCKRIMKNIYFVEVSLEEKEENSQQIFESLNSTGKDLSTPDLIKNALFDEKDEKLYEDTWQATFEEDDDVQEDEYFWNKVIGAQNFKRRNIELFLFSYILLQHNKTDPKGQQKDDDLYKQEYLFNNYKKLIGKFKNTKDKEPFINELIVKAKLYREHLNYEKLAEPSSSESIIHGINVAIFGFPVTAIIPYLLFILSEATKEDQDEMILLLVNYFVRRIGIRARSTDYGGAGGFASFIRKNVSTKDDLLHALDSFGANNKFPLDEEFKKDFPKVTLTNRHSKTILYLIEEFLHSEHDGTNIKSYNSYQLEHVMPKKWQEHWPLEKSNTEKRNSTILSIGNLALLTTKLNGKLQNKGWEDKKPSLKEYSSGMKTLDKKYLNKSQWDEKVINERSQFLAKQVLEIWPYPDFSKKGNKGK